MIENSAQVIANEDEIDLRELWRTIVKGWKIIAVVTTVVTLLAVFNVLSKPNIYESKVLLLSTEQTKAGVGGGLAALAGMAGVDVSGGAGPMPQDAYAALLNDYVFMKGFAERHNLYDRFNNSQKNFKFALGFSGIYDLTHLSSSDPKPFASLEPAQKEGTLYGVAKGASGMISVEADKKTMIITLSAKSPDAELAKDVVNYFLKDASEYLRANDMKNNDRQILYYEEALANTPDVTLKAQLANLESALIQKKVMAQANEFYNVKPLVGAYVAPLQDRAGPKRGLTVAVSFVTALILSIFGIFLWEFIKNRRKEN